MIIELYNDLGLKSVFEQALHFKTPPSFVTPLDPWVSLEVGKAYSWTLPATDAAPY